MKQVVIFDGLQEFTIRPPGLFDEYVAMLATDVQEFFGDRRRFEAVPCPGCGQDEARPAFTKLTFDYVRCSVCDSLFVSPRPTEEIIEAFMQSSKAIDLWSHRIEPETATDRIERIFRPRVDWILGTALPLLPDIRVLVDVGTKYPLFLREISGVKNVKKFVVTSVAPAVNEADLTDAVPGLAVFRDAGAAVAAGIRAEIVCAQECMERAARPAALLQTVTALTAEGGLLFLTTRTGNGFDMRVLGGRAKNLLPPVHLNLLSLDGLQRLLASQGFEVLELSTPGQLDTELVVQAAREDPTFALPPFVDELIRRRDEGVHQAFQAFLQQALLSSHVRIAARKARRR